MSEEKYIEDLQSDDFETRKKAIWELGEMGKDAIKAVPALISALNDDEDELHHLATFALEKIGKQSKEAFPELIKAISDKNQRIAGAVERILLKIGRDIEMEENLAIALIEHRCTAS